MAGLNFRRGFFRFWLLFSFLFAALAGAAFYPDIKREFLYAEALRQPLPEGYTALWETPARPWETVSKAAAVAIGVPALVLVLGVALGWVLSGFARGNKAP